MLLVRAFVSETAVVKSVVAVGFASSQASLELFLQMLLDRRDRKCSAESLGDWVSGRRLLARAMSQSLILKWAKHSQSESWL
jgi:hypothetical protein